MRFEAVIICLLTLGGCLQPTDAELPVASGPAQTTSWSYAGSFGGHAEELVRSDDPWEIRYRPGTFRLISGLCVTDEEVWVCDLAISRLQIFDYQGRFVRELGAGVPIPETLASDEQLYYEEQDYDYKTKPPRWEDQAGSAWGLDHQQLFKAADVAVTDEGFLLADQAMSGRQRSARRHHRVALLRWDGSVQQMQGTDIYWPAYLAVDGVTVASAEPRGNSLRLAEITDERWPQKLVTQDTSFDRIMEVKLQYAGHPDYLLGMALASNAGAGPAKFNSLGGVALAFDKLIACDTGNARLQVFDTRRGEIDRWGKLIRIVPARKRDGSMRFEAPRDVDVDDKATIYVLDAARLEVAVLGPNFERTASFGSGELLEPFAMDASPDGRHCFVTDRRSNLVHHYVRGD